MGYSAAKNTVKKWQNQDLNSGILIPGPTLLNSRGVHLREQNAVSPNKRITS